MSIIQYVKESLSSQTTINESSLSRLLQHMQEHDTGTITAFRSTKDCTADDPYSPENIMTYKENRQRQKSLLLKLQNLGYDVTSVKGSYIENYGSDNAREVGESVFFVVDSDDKGTLKQDLMKLGEEFDQDSILYIPTGGQKSILIGTNHCPDAYPPYHETVEFNQRGLGKEGEFMTKVKGRPFVFESVKAHHKILNDRNWRLGRKAGANKHWSEITLSEDDKF